MTVTSLKSSMQQSVLSKSTRRTVHQVLLPVEEPVERRTLFVASPVAMVHVRVLTPRNTGMDQLCSGSVGMSVWRAASSVTAPVPQTTSPVGQHVSVTSTSADSSSTLVGISAFPKNGSAVANVLITTLSAAKDAAIPTPTGSVVMNA